MRAIRVVHGAVALVVLAGCASPTTAEAPPPTPDTASEWNARCVPAGLSGRLVAASGQDALDAALVDVDLCPLRISPYTDATKISAVASNGTTTVLTGAAPRLDRLGALTARRVTDVEGLGRPRAFGPSVSADGTVYYVDPEAPPGTADGTSAVRSYRQPGPATTLFSSTTVLTLTAPLADGTLAVVEETPAGETTAPGLIVIRGTQVIRRLPLDLPSVAKLLSSGDLLAVGTLGKDAAQGVVIDAADGRVRARLPPGWRPLAFSPDGARLLVRRDDSALGVLRTSALAAPVELLGTLPTGTVWSAAWTAGQSSP